MKTASVLLRLVSLTLGSLVFWVSSTFAATLPVQVMATDAVAGYPAAFRTSLINPGQAVRFVVEKPDHSVVQISAQADLEGVAKADFYGHQTKVAGTYRVAVVYPGSSDASPQASFKVYPDRVSASQSTLRSTLQLVEVNSDATFLTATLYDAYRNPIEGHRVSLISSRSDDTITALQNGMTNAQGEASFKIKSRYAGFPCLPPSIQR
ncbi:Ig-like domain-containing protein [Candidatus Peregrinibacteria bacterium]|nr:MAG: Ig-like domain-containing protein [Candidatus Peregrinibacteria bacterium]